MCCSAVLGLPAPPLRPQPDAEPRHVELEPVPASVRRARSFLRESLADLDPEQQETAVLLTSELVTNAILHARTPVRLGIVVDDDGQALVCVADRVSDPTQLKPQDHSQTRPGGRGLALVADLSKDWGTTTYSGGKTVWFVLPAASRSLKVG